MEIKTPVLKTLTGSTPKPPPWLHLAIWFWACILLALLQISWGGYQLGVGNQGIQIAFLEKLHDHELFPHDAMVNETLRSYPSFFFHLISRLLSFADLSTLYLTLHVAATAGVFAAVVALSNAITRNRWAGIVCALLLVAGRHHAAAAGEDLYSTGFTHTWAIFPLSLLALYLFFRDRHVAAFLLAGLIFNFHALEAAHLFAIMGLASLVEIRTLGIKRLAVAVGAFVAAALPTIIVIVTQAISSHAHGESFSDPLWLQLTYIRSADHSFPSTWWQTGKPDIPRFLGVISLAAVALGFRLPRRMRRKLLMLVAGIGLLFVIGTVFTDVLHIPIVIRAQLFRSSRLLYILSLIIIAHACVKAWRLPWLRPKAMPAWAAWLEFSSACATALCMALPALMPFVPYALILAMVVALLNGRLAWHEALFAGVSLLVCLLATQTIEFVIPGIAPLTATNRWLLTTINWRAMLQNQWPPGYAWGVGVVAVTLAVITSMRLKKNALATLLACATLAGVVALLGVLPIVKRESEPDPAWANVQLWINTHTPKTAVILTPPTESGFRIFSQRSIVGEWRDGTQLYFKAGFAKPWWDAMNALLPNIVVRADKKDLENRGTPLQQLDDEKIVAIANSPATHADYIVLPKVPVNEDGVIVMTNTHGMKVAYENSDWVVYEPKFMDFTGSPGDATLVDEDNFIRQKVLPGIERYRKSDVRVEVVDAAGKPVSGLDARITQTSSAFGFGCSLPFFQVPSVDTKADYKPPAVTPNELSHFLEMFNYSVIPFSAQWRFTEPQQGKPNYADLDKYVDWCNQNAVRPEFRFLAGYQPTWVKNKVPRDQADLILGRAMELAKRYGGKITDWQITSEDVGLKEIGMEEYNDQTRKDRVTTFFTKLRQYLPDARLGVSDDARFFSPKTGPDAKVDMYRGLDTLRTLQKLGIKIDYAAIEAKHPLGLWASGKSIYDTLDAFAQTGVKIHITELGVAVGDRIEGTVRDGTWTPQMQADYYERFFTICYSHPAVEAINIMGIGDATWRPGQGLLDAAGNPTPAFIKLKQLITDRWRTHLTDKLPTSGPLQFHGFQGAYDFSLNLPGGKTATATFSVTPLGPGVDPVSANKFRFVLGADGTLKQQNP